MVRNLPTGDLDAAPSGEEARHAPAYEPKPLGFWGEADRERIMRPRQQPLIPPDHEETPSAVPPASERPASEPDSVPEPLLYGEEGLPWDKVPDNHAAPSFHEAPQAFAAPQPPTAGAAPLPETAPARRRAATSRQPRQTLRARTARNRAAWRRPSTRRTLRVHGADRRDVSAAPGYTQRPRQRVPG